MPLPLSLSAQLGRDVATDDLIGRYSQQTVEEFRFGEGKTRAEPFYPVIAAQQELRPPFSHTFSEIFDTMPFVRGSGGDGHDV